jgi:hypothetical protein
MRVKEFRLRYSLWGTIKRETPPKPAMATTPDKSMAKAMGTLIKAKNKNRMSIKMSTFLTPIL